jgi:predicted permease
VTRLRPGVSWAEATGQLQALSRALREMPNFHYWYKNFEERIIPYQKGMTLDVRNELWIAWAAVLMVLAIGCVNIAGLLLARAAARSREIATRMALGGARWRIVRQLLTESLLLSLGGCAVGMAVGSFSIEGLKSLGAQEFEIWHPIQLDARVLLAMLGISVITSLGFGLLPALRTSRLDIRSVLVEGGRGIAGARTEWPRHALIVGEVALSLVLLVSAGLLVRTLAYLHGLSPGFDTRHVVAAEASLQDARYTTSASVNRLFESSLRRIRRIPGVESAAVALTLPYERPLNYGFRVVDGNMAARDGIEMSYASPGYFAALRIPVVRGRAIEENDSPDGAPVAVVSESFARKYLGGVDRALGHHIDVVGPPRAVVGVVGDVQQHSGLDPGAGPLSVEPMIYVPAAQTNDKFLTLVHTWFAPKWVVRTNGKVGPAPLQSLLQSAIAGVDPQLPLARVQTIEELQGRYTASQRYLAALFTLFAALALVLAALGLYGLISSSIAQRTHELGVRMALGATAPQAIATVMRPGVTLAAVGILLGWALSLAAGRVLQHQLFGVRASDPATLLVTAALLLAVTVGASLAPALRILRLDPARTLRSE